MRLLRLIVSLLFVVMTILFIGFYIKEKTNRKRFIYDKQILAWEDYEKTIVAKIDYN